MKLLIRENTPKLETERLILRKFTHMDIEALFEILSDEEVNTYLPWFTLKSIEEAELFLQERFLFYYDKASAYRYAICFKEDDRPIGYVLLSVAESNDLGYGLKKEFWNRGIATEASKAVVERIKRAGYPFITATHDRNNPPSGQVMKKLGMTYKYSYVELWQPKNITVTYRMYQLNFDGNNERTYMEYWNKYPEHFIEKHV
ncbi:MAG: GNAT family N-acetyltransferase [Firmicutes bacterium]|nr:GNAT family N-acetyltransferase [Bacillota bacterium]